MMGWIASVWLVASSAGSVIPTDRTEREWWYWAVEACLKEYHEDPSACAESWRRALELQPGFVRGWVELGDAQMRAAEDPSEAYERATLTPTTRAFAHLGLARWCASEGDDESLQEALTKTLEAELYLTTAEVRGIDEFRAYRREDWWKRWEREVTRAPKQRLIALADADDSEGLAALVNSLSFVWRGDSTAPCYLVHELLVDAIGGRASTDESLEVVRVRRVADATDTAFGAVSFQPWVESVLALAKDQRRSHATNWKAIESTDRKFRSHQFRSLMKTFVPIERSTRDMGDLLGTMATLGVLTLTRECLVEYEVSGYDLEHEWRTGWKNLQEYRQLAGQLGDHGNVSSAYENAFYYLTHLPPGAEQETRSEFLKTEVVGKALIEMTLSELALPLQERQIHWTWKWMRDWKIYPG